MRVLYRSARLLAGRASVIGRGRRLGRSRRADSRRSFRPVGAGTRRRAGAGRPGRFSRDAGADIGAGERAPPLWRASAPVHLGPARSAVAARRPDAIGRARRGALARRDPAVPVAGPRPPPPAPPPGPPPTPGTGRP